jgi:hypothetical protein
VRLGRLKPVPKMNATTTAAKRGKKLLKHKPKLKPAIVLPGGDIAQPAAVLAKKFGMTVRTLKGMGVPSSRVAGCLYGSQRRAGEVIAERLNSPIKRTRGGRR